MSMSSSLLSGALFMSQSWRQRCLGDQYEVVEETEELLEWRLMFPIRDIIQFHQRDAPAPKSVEFRIPQTDADERPFLDRSLERHANERHEDGPFEDDVRRLRDSALDLFNARVADDLDELTGEAPPQPRSGPQSGSGRQSRQLPVRGLSLFQTTAPTDLRRARSALHQTIQVDSRRAVHFPASPSSPPPSPTVHFPGEVASPNDRSEESEEEDSDPDSRRSYGRTTRKAVWSVGSDSGGLDSGLARHLERSTFARTRPRLATQRRHPLGSHPLDASSSADSSFWQPSIHTASDSSPDENRSHENRSHGNRSHDIKAESHRDRDVNHRDGGQSPEPFGDLIKANLQTLGKVECKIQELQDAARIPLAEEKWVTSIKQSPQAIRRRILISAGTPSTAVSHAASPAALSTAAISATAMSTSPTAISASPTALSAPPSALSPAVELAAVLSAAIQSYSPAAVQFPTVAESFTPKAQATSGALAQEAGSVRAAGHSPTRLGKEIRLAADDARAHGPVPPGVPWTYHLCLLLSIFLGECTWAGASCQEGVSGAEMVRAEADGEEDMAWDEVSGRGSVKPKIPPLRTPALRTSVFRTSELRTPPLVSAVHAQIRSQVLAPALETQNGAEAESRAFMSQDWPRPNVALRQEGIFARATTLDSRSVRLLRTFRSLALVDAALVTIPGDGVLAADIDLAEDTPQGAKGRHAVAGWFSGSLKQIKWASKLPASLSLKNLALKTAWLRKRLTSVGTVVLPADDFLANMLTKMAPAHTCAAPFVELRPCGDVVKVEFKSGLYRTAVLAVQFTKLCLLRVPRWLCRKTYGCAKNFRATFSLINRKIERLLLPVPAATTGATTTPAVGVATTGVATTGGTTRAMTPTGGTTTGRTTTGGIVAVTTTVATAPAGATAVLESGEGQVSSGAPHTLSAQVSERLSADTSLIQLSSESECSPSACSSSTGEAGAINRLVANLVNRRQKNDHRSRNHMNRMELTPMTVADQQLTIGLFALMMVLMLPMAVVMDWWFAEIQWGPPDVSWILTAHDQLRIIDYSDVHWIDSMTAYSFFACAAAQHAPVWTHQYFFPP
ncbi:hypothetical protein GNI_026030 [Gregarina niphandrodes]|uniref:Uncharacterized protein n=1 Tax=Gregarina niphandrodes TaxID=110365 RepID=A0A023BBD1_GRENI|nr:hypothetical protein GNI_026030 [Gregarina niphandrodes]EZG79502.1 hypothetical protein GNI_026030 [Gregarina niphandrodes]|eukprot:XP_011134426.1 hypothetical protein GNI_026030 [Gregarina niphandrodes]